MKGHPHSAMRRALAKKHACYILITCDKPSDGGEMQVEMSYEGDTILASYLLQGAQDYLDDEAPPNQVATVHSMESVAAKG